MSMIINNLSKYLKQNQAKLKMLNIYSYNKNN